ncbi:MAG: tyrosine-type recombinase/integrase [Acidobacteriota bacterium]
MAKFQPVKKYVGVVYYESSERKHLGKPDRCFYAVFKAHGRKVRVKVGWLSEGFTAELASQTRAELMRDLRMGKDLAKKDPALGEVWTEYYAWLQANRKRPDNQRWMYEKYVEPALGHKPLSAIAPLDLERLRRSMQKADLSPQTISHALALVRTIFNRATAWGMWQGGNPAKQITFPKLDNRRERFLSVDEARSLLGVLAERSQDVHDMSVLSLHCGLRLSEICRLRWEDVDLSRMTAIIWVTDKAGKGLTRTAYLTPEVAAMFESRGPGQGLVFASRSGRVIADLSKTFSRVVDSLGFNRGVEDRRQRVTFHTLRHTFASWLVISGTPIYTLKGLLGHKTLAMSERYAKLSPDHEREAISRLPDLGGPPSAPCGAQET